MIKEDDYVIFKKADFMKIFQVKKSKPIMIDKLKCKFDNLIEKPFGYKYELKDQQLHLIRTNPNSDDTNKVDIVRDNRNLLDKSDNQKLTREEIENLKKVQELSGTEIIDRLIENSASFQQKTEYSQEKYIKKKKEKYLSIYQIMKPSIRTLCDYYTLGNAKRKILNMRVDTISQILAYSNVAAHRNVLILESCKGLLLAALVERMAGHGNIINLSPNGSHISTKETLNYMNFPSEYTKNLYHFPLEKIDKVQSYIEEMVKKVENQINPTYKEKQSQKLEVGKLVLDLFQNRQIDCMIIACKFRPLPILNHMIGFLDSNRYFAVYSPIQEPLIECHTYLKRNEKAIHVELSDSWLREYQVLPERTHPKVMMDCCSGFILSGITISNKN